MKIRFVAAVLAAFFMLPAVSAAAFTQDDGYSPAADAPVFDVHIEPQRETPEHTAIIDITPQTEGANESSITVTENVAADNDGEYSIPVHTAPPEPSGIPRPFTPSGTGTTLDNAGSDDGKEFFTITTPDENVFYLVIDRQRGTENVYFLNAVTEADLLSLAQMPERPVPPVIEAPPVIPEPEPEPPPAPEKGGGAGTLIMVAVILLIGGGAAWYLKIYRPKQQVGGNTGEFDGEDYGIDGLDTYDMDGQDDADISAGDWTSDDTPPDGDDDQ